MNVLPTLNNVGIQNEKWRREYNTEGNWELRENIHNCAFSNHSQILQRKRLAHTRPSSTLKNLTRDGCGGHLSLCVYPKRYAGWNAPASPHLVIMIVLLTLNNERGRKKQTMGSTKIGRGGINHKSKLIQATKMNESLIKRFEPKHHSSSLIM